MYKTGDYVLVKRCSKQICGCKRWTSDSYLARFVEQENAYPGRIVVDIERSNRRRRFYPKHVRKTLPEELAYFKLAGKQ